MPPCSEAAHTGREGRKHLCQPSPSGAHHSSNHLPPEHTVQPGVLSHCSAVLIPLPTVNSSNTLAEPPPSRADRSRAQSTGFQSMC